MVVVQQIFFNHWYVNRKYEKQDIYSSISHIVQIEITD